MLSTGTALLYTVVLGAVIFFCRVFPFILFRDKRKNGSACSGEGGPANGMSGDPGPAKGGAGLTAFLGFVEKVAPPAAMTVLAVNSLAGPVKAAGFPPVDALVPLAAALCTAVLHIWKRNALVSIFGGTALYMLLEHVMRAGV